MKVGSNHPSKTKIDVPQARIAARKMSRGSRYCVEASGNFSRVWMVRFHVPWRPEPLHRPSLLLGSGVNSNAPRTARA